MEARERNSSEGSPSAMAPSRDSDLSLPLPILLRVPWFPNEAFARVAEKAEPVAPFSDHLPSPSADELFANFVASPRNRRRRSRVYHVVLAMAAAVGFTMFWHSPLRRVDESNSNRAGETERVEVLPPFQPPAPAPAVMVAEPRSVRRAAPAPSPRPAEVSLAPHIIPMEPGEVP
jgi:hypothetical protein